MSCFPGQDPGDMGVKGQKINAKVKPGPRNLITDVAGIKVGNASSQKARTGATLVLPDQPAIAGVDVRGGAPGTRETDALDPSSLLGGRVDALVLSGGSVYGLDAASGVTAWLGAQGRGFEIASSPLTAPIVPAAILFDLANGGDKNWGETPPYAALGRQACLDAAEQFALGNSGAGLGAKAGTYKGGLGSASALTDDGFEVGALMAVNAFGAPTQPGTGTFWAAPFEMNGEFGGVASDQAGRMSPAAIDPLVGSKFSGVPPAPDTPRQNTTIGVVAVNAALTGAQANRIAAMAHDGMARALRPIHTELDGDVIFVLATGKKPLSDDTLQYDLMRLGSLGADCVARAIARGVYEAETLGEMVSYKDQHRP